mmetsp:Transcript_38800/g.81566  ORF Transcript_38800/g.81566 Transcript_38800/m.81566 type:complete len:224 (+) Transcript_38800:140-811(+)
MKVLIQNLQKRKGLATQLAETYNPDVLLVQEINLNSEFHPFPAHNVSSTTGYGTAIGSSSSQQYELTDIQTIESPYAEFGGFIRKKTIMANINSIRFVSFHGYNGQPFKNVQKLVAHVNAVLEVQLLLDSSSNNNTSSKQQPAAPAPALFAGDFNTWSKEHFEAVQTCMEKHGFRHVYSWPYPGREYPLDHAFVRGLKVIASQDYSCGSDHRGAIVEIQLEDD